MRSVITLISILISILLVCAQKVVIDGIEYTLKDHSYVEVSKVDKKQIGEDIVLPAYVTIEGKEYPLKKIGRAKFGETKIRSIVFPNTLEEIGRYAFAGCVNLKEITLPNSVKSVGTFAFGFCSKLEKVIFPDDYCELKYGFSVKSSFHGSKNICYISSNSGSLPGYLLTAIEKDNHLGDAYKRMQQDSVNETTTVVQSQTTVPQIAAPASSIPAIEKEEKALVVSDVDQNIPTVNASNDRTFALVIANEEYSEDGIQNVEHAIHDGEVFKEYLNKTLGLSENQIRYRANATLNQIKSDLNWISDVAQAFDGEANIIFYYAGHGIPDEKTGGSYLLPADGFASDVSSGYSLNALYDKLGALPANKTMVFLDACFSGATRSGGMLISARGVAIVPKQSKPSGNMVVISATQGDETAFPYKEKAHGMFTYFLLKKLQDTNGSCTLGDLSDYVTTNVKRSSIVNNSKIQTPSVVTSQNASSNWRGWTLR